MDKLEKKKLIVLGVGITIVLVVIIGGGFLLFGDKEPNNPSDGDEITGNIPEVSPEKAEGMYGQLTEKCSGALIWDLKVGDKVEITDLNNTNACQNNNYYSKMIAYSYNDIGVTVYVNVLKNENGNLYRLDNTLVDVYSAETLSESLEKGTTYIYTYKEDGENYKLVQVELMEPVIFDEGVQE